MALAESGCKTHGPEKLVWRATDTFVTSPAVSLSSASVLECGSVTLPSGVASPIKNKEAE